MFAWDLYRSAEATFSRWALKRLLRFFLKKKLGDYILGDIDLDQLDVQLRQGIVQLTDLAFNVDFLNRMLGFAPVMVKEGSIASLSVKVPFNMKDWQIEVEELELVLAPMNGAFGHCCDSTHKNEHSATASSPKKQENKREADSSHSVSAGVHEGVKTIAKIVKLLLTSFHFRLKNLIIAFDPGSEALDRHSELSRILVFRIADIEFGTHISDDISFEGVSLLGISKLTNFVEFHGAVVEFLEIKHYENKTENLSSFSRILSELYSENSPPLGVSTNILCGPTGGFSGVVNLSIPWKNGYLDVYKLAAEIVIEPVHVLLLPSTILWMVSIRGYLMELMNECECHTYQPICYNSHGHTGGADSFSSAQEKMVTSVSRSHNFSLQSPLCQESTLDDFHPSLHVIPDWISCPEDSKFNMNFEALSDYESSIDQFFDCFDVMMSSSQANIGQSGIWNLACSVFNAVTSPSNHVSASENVTSEQQTVEANLKVTIAALSVSLILHDEKKHGGQVNTNQQQASYMWETSCKSFTSASVADSSTSGECFESCMSSKEYVESDHSTEQNVGRSDMHYVDILCSNFVCKFQILPQQTKFEATMQHIQVGHNFIEQQALGNNCIQCKSKHMVQHLQAGIQGALPPSAVMKDGKAPDSSFTTDLHQMLQSVHADIFNVSPYGSVRVTLLESFGECFGEYHNNSHSKLCFKTSSSTNFSLKLPPFILWVDIHVVNLLLDYLQNIEKSLLTCNLMKDSKCVSISEGTDISTDRHVENVKQIDLVSSGVLQGNIVLPSSRIILCIDLDSSCHCPTYHWDTFICFDILENVSTARQKSSQRSCKRQMNSDNSSICLDTGGFDVFFVNVSSKNDIGSNFQSSSSCHYSSNKVLSATHQLNNHHSAVNLLWQKEPSVNPRIVQRVRSFIASKDPSKRDEFVETAGEFAFVTRAAEEADSQLRQELLQSSSFLINIHLSLVSANLTHKEYIILHHIARKIHESLQIDAHFDDTSGKRFQSENSLSVPAGTFAQVSVLVECDFLDIFISSNAVEETDKLLQRELPGAWTSFRLKVANFELLSISHFSGLRDACFFGIGHGEGDLWGSVSRMDDGPSAGSSIHEFLLISFKNSILRRGDGDGQNATSYGFAGTSIIHLKCPQAHHIFTSIIAKCGTIIAPGCRFDWFDSIVAFFRPPFHLDETEGCPEDLISFDDTHCNASFRLDLLDVALSYEPHIIGADISGSEPHIIGADISGSNHGSSNMNRINIHKYVACILAASSLSLCQFSNDAPNENYNVRLCDFGLLICKWPGPNNLRQYDAAHLRRSGYVKIASDTAIAVIVRTKCDKDLFWEIELSGLHVKLNTCSDTTVGLFCLLSQFQQLFTPDIDDALMHLQSRWHSAQSAVGSNKLGTDKISESAGESGSQVGLMDEIIDGIFSEQEDKLVRSNSCHPQNQFLGNKKFVWELRDGNLGCDGNSTSNVTLVGPGQGNSGETLQPLCANVQLLPDIMESYCVPGSFSRENQSATSYSTNESLDTQTSVTHMAGDGMSGWYKNKALVLLENHIQVTGDDHLEKQVIHIEDSNIHPFPGGVCKPKCRIILKQSEVRWRMFGGTDWSDTERTSSGSLNSSGRDSSACLEFQFVGVALQYNMYPDVDLIASHLILNLEDFFLIDSSPNAPWKMVLGYHHSKRYPRESCAKAFKLDLESVRPNPAIPLEEYRLQLAILPVRLHLDQSQLDFLVSFFAGFSMLDSHKGTNNLNQQLHSEEESCSNGNVPNEALLPFFQKCDIWPIMIWVDYIPRHIDMAALRGGNYIELINLVSWKGIDLRLKHVHAVGIYGWGGICEVVAGEWLEDISKNQVHKLLNGLKPINSLYSVTSGAVRLVSLPVRNYKKDRRLVKGIQRGAVSFIRSISIEAVGLGVHLAAGVHDILLKTECALASSPQHLNSFSEDKSSSIRSNQPQDVLHGMQQAYESLSDGIGRTASTLVGKPLKAYQRGAGASLALASAVRAAPAAAVAPASSAARAVHCALLGVRNSLDPDHKKDSMGKYHGSSSYQD